MVYSQMRGAEHGEIALTLIAASVLEEGYGDRCLGIRATISLPRLSFWRVCSSTVRRNRLRVGTDMTLLILILSGLVIVVRLSPVI